MTDNFVTPKMMLYCATHNIAISTDQGRVYAGQQFVIVDELGNVLQKYNYVQIKQAADAWEPE